MLSSSSTVPSLFTESSGIAIRYNQDFWKNKNRSGCTFPFLIKLCFDFKDFLWKISLIENILKIISVTTVTFGSKLVHFVAFSLGRDLSFIVMFFFVIWVFVTPGSGIS